MIFSIPGEVQPEKAMKKGGQAALSLVPVLLLKFGAKIH
jgi:hypothetical protein